MIGEISPRTHEEYKAETIRARRILVKHFYAWAHKRGFYFGTLQEATEIERSIFPPIGIHRLVFVPAGAESESIPERPRGPRGRVKRFAP